MGTCARSGRSSARHVIVRVAHLYPDYLNIYADRGNIAVLERRAQLRGHQLAITAIGLGEPLFPGRHDLLYIGGGQDREQTMVAPDLAAHSETLSQTGPSPRAVKGSRKVGILLDETLVIWGGEFGRTPMSESGYGRDHNPWGFTMWMAGGGIKGGVTHGATDEMGLYAVEDRVHVHDLHATILHCLGMDHKRLTCCTTAARSGRRSTAAR